MLSLEKIYKIMYLALPKLPLVEQTAMTLVVGLPGAGKSTVTNYLLGYVMEKDGEGLVQSVEANPPAKMGDSMEPITLLPTAYKGNDGLVYCDCPGFLSSSDDEYGICSSIVLETMIKAVKKLPTILVVIDFNTIQAERGAGLKALSGILGRFLKEPETVSESLLFLINKAPLEDITKEGLKVKIKNLVAYEEKKLTNLKLKFEQCKITGEKITDEDLSNLNQAQQMLAVMHLLQSHFDNNVILMNLFDQGQSKLSVIERVKQISAIPPEKFDFNQYSSARLQFTQAIAQIMQEAISAVDKRETLYLQIEKLQQEEKETSEKISLYQGKIKLLHQEASLAVQQPAIVTTQQTILKKNLTEQQILKTAQQNLLDEHKLLQTELEKLNETTLVPYWNDTIDCSMPEKTYSLAQKYGVDWLLLHMDEALYQQVEEGKRFHYQGIPFAKVELQHTGGILSDEESYPEKGVYSILYKGSLFEKSVATITIFVRSCDLPENMNKSEILKTKLNENIAKQHLLKTKLEGLTDEQKILEAAYSALKKDDLTEFYQCKEQFEQQVLMLQANINQLREKRKVAENDLEEVKSIINQRKNLFESVVKVLTVLTNNIIPLKTEFLAAMQVLFPDLKLEPALPIKPAISVINEARTEFIEKAWYFDEQAKSEISQVKDYSLIPASQKDIAKVVEHYQHHPMPGYDIRSVEVIYNPTMNRAFALNIELLQQRDNQKVFVPKWPVESKTEEERSWRGEVITLCAKLAAPYKDPKYPAVKILPLWHGTKPEILDSLFKTGYVNLASTDSGFFGKGIYSAHEAEYCFRVYSSGALILNWVATFSPYPVIDGDMPKLAEKGNYANYDAHFVPVKPADPNKPDEVNYYPCKPNEQHKYIEVVVFEKSQCLPRYLVKLQPKLPKEPSLNLGKNPYILMPGKSENRDKVKEEFTGIKPANTPNMKIS